VRRGDRERIAHRAAAHRPTKPRATPPRISEKPLGLGLVRRGAETVAAPPARSGCLGGRETRRGKRKREETAENGEEARPRAGTHTRFDAGRLFRSDGSRCAISALRHELCGCSCGLRDSARPPSDGGAAARGTVGEGMRCSVPVR
jgi:hypothetical protein